MPAVAVIDEDEAVCCQAKDCFRLAGFAVHSARTASDGAAMLRRKRFDLVLVDVFLREASGTLIAQLAANTNTRVLLTTNHAAAASRFRNFDVPHLLKPFDLQELSREATRVMAENRQVMLRVILNLERLRRGLADLEVLTEDAKRLVAVSQAILARTSHSALVTGPPATVAGNVNPFDVVQRADQKIAAGRIGGATRLIDEAYDAYDQNVSWFRPGS